MTLQGVSFHLQLTYKHIHTFTVKITAVYTVLVVSNKLYCYGIFLICAKYTYT